MKDIKTQEEAAAAIKELRDSLPTESTRKKFSIKADGEDCGLMAEDVLEITQYQVNYINSRLDSLYDYISSIQSQLWSHMNTGHLPPISGAGDMEKALKVLGLDKDFDVQKKTIYASTGEIRNEYIEIRSKDKS